MPQKVIFIADLDEDGCCPACAVDYAECDCPGPDQDDEFDYEWDGDDLYATRKVDEE